MAYGYIVCKDKWGILLFLWGPGWIQPVYGILGAHGEYEADGIRSLTMFSFRRKKEPLNNMEEFKKANPEKERMPHLITDNGGQFVSKGFKEFLSHSGLQHTRTAPNHPQSNGKIERFHKTLRNECLRRIESAALLFFPSGKKEAVKDMKEFVEYYNNVRLHSAIDYITPRDKLLGNAEKILAERDKKLEQARKRRRAKYLMLKAA